jgi:hypothetical protein
MALAIKKEVYEFLFPPSSDTCSICLEPWEDRRAISHANGGNLHPICLSCIQNLVNYSTSEVRCPSCRVILSKRCIQQVSNSYTTIIWGMTKRTAIFAVSIFLRDLWILGAIGHFRTKIETAREHLPFNGKEIFVLVCRLGGQIYWDTKSYSFLQSFLPEETLLSRSLAQKDIKAGIRWVCFFNVFAIFSKRAFVLSLIALCILDLYEGMQYAHRQMYGEE